VKLINYTMFVKTLLRQKQSKCKKNLD